MLVKIGVQVLEITIQVACRFKKIQFIVKKIMEMYDNINEE